MVLTLLTLNKIEMTSLDLLKEIEAWLCFNTEPSKEETAKLRKSINEHVSEQLRLGAFIGWVEVSERLPEPKKHVLVLRTNPNAVTTGYLHEWGHWIWSNLNGSTHKADHIYKVTHWMPLPEPPCL